MILINNDERLTQLIQFLNVYTHEYQFDLSTLCPASADASFRRYFRVQGLKTSYIIMDAPPIHEDCGPFIHVQTLFLNARLNVPVVLEQDLKQGYLLLSDFGNTTYLKALQQGQDHRPLYHHAIDALIQLQTHSYSYIKENKENPAISSVLPLYNADKLLQEMSLFETWFLNEHHQMILTDKEKSLLKIGLNLIVKQCLAQTEQCTVWVHRDYHCRNLMVVNTDNTDTDNVGILDFQDALTGAYTYDLVSLLRDAYIDWPETAQIDLLVYYWKGALAAGLSVPDDFGQLWREFEWMSLQRHLKVLGIFARLYHRDGKSGYLNDLPVVLDYLKRTVQRYDGLAILVRLLDRVEGVNRTVGVTF